MHTCTTPKSLFLHDHLSHQKHINYPLSTFGLQFFLEERYNKDVLHFHTVRESERYWLQRFSTEERSHELLPFFSIGTPGLALTLRRRFFLSALTTAKEVYMSSESVYKIIEMVGSSSVSWEEAAQNAVKSAGLSLRDLRIAEVVQQDMILDDGKAVIFRTKIKLSFKIVSD